MRRSILAGLSLVALAVALVFAPRPVAAYPPPPVPTAWVDWLQLKNTQNNTGTVLADWNEGGTEAYFPSSWDNRASKCSAIGGSGGWRTPYTDGWLDSRKVSVQLRFNDLSTVIKVLTPDSNGDWSFTDEFVDDTTTSPVVRLTSIEITLQQLRTVENNPTWVTLTDNNGAYKFTASVLYNQ